MSSKDRAQEKVAAADKACGEVLDSWKAAVAALGSSVSVNGFGIIHDPSAFRQMLGRAKGEIDAALATMERVDWPTGTDYDQL